MTPTRQVEPPTLSTRMKVEWPILIGVIAVVVSYTRLSVQMDALVTAVNKLVGDVGEHGTRLTKLESRQ